MQTGPRAGTDPSLSLGCPAPQGCGQVGELELKSVLLRLSGQGRGSAWPPGPKRGGEDRGRDRGGIGAEKKRGGRGSAGRAGVRDPAALGLGGVKAGRPGPAQLGSAPPAESRDAGPRARVTSASAADGGGDMASELDVRARLQRAGQEHLLRFCAELAPGPRAALLAQLELLEPEALREHCRRAAAACARPPAPAPDLAARLRPLPPERVGSASGVAPQTRRLWEEEGRRGGGPGGGRASLRKAASPTERGDRGGGILGVQFASFVKSTLSHAPARGWGLEPPNAAMLAAAPRPHSLGRMLCAGHAWMASCPAHVLTAGDPLDTCTRSFSHQRRRSCALCLLAWR